MKPVNRNLLLVGIPAALVLIAGLFLFSMGEALLDTAAGLFPNSSGEVGDVEGYAILLNLLGAGFSGLAGLLVQALAAAAILYGGILLVLGAVARLVYRATPGRVLAYRILTGIQLVVFVLPAPAFAQLWRSSVQSDAFLPLWPVCLLLLVVLAVLTGRNTYTARIWNG